MKKPTVVRVATNVQSMESSDDKALPPPTSSDDERRKREQRTQKTKPLCAIKRRESKKNNLSKKSKKSVKKRTAHKQQKSSKKKKVAKRDDDTYLEDPPMPLSETTQAEPDISQKAPVAVTAAAAVGTQQEQAPVRNKKSQSKPSKEGASDVPPPSNGGYEIEQWDPNGHTPPPPPLEDGEQKAKIVTSCNDKIVERHAIVEFGSVRDAKGRRYFHQHAAGQPQAVGMATPALEREALHRDAIMTVTPPQNHRQNYSMDNVPVNPTVKLTTAPLRPAVVATNNTNYFQANAFGARGSGRSGAENGKHRNGVRNAAL